MIGDSFKDTFKIIPICKYAILELHAKDSISVNLVHRLFKIELLMDIKYQFTYGKESTNYCFTQVLSLISLLKPRIDCKDIYTKLLDKTLVSQSDIDRLLSIQNDIYQICWYYRGAFDDNVLQLLCDLPEPAIDIIFCDLIILIRDDPFEISKVEKFMSNIPQYIRKDNYYYNYAYELLSKR